jgi:hypothetical protein
MLLLVGGDDMQAADAQLTSLLMELSNLRDGEHIEPLNYKQCIHWKGVAEIAWVPSYVEFCVALYL